MAQILYAVLLNRVGNLINERSKMKNQNDKQKMNKSLTSLSLLLCFIILNTMIVFADHLSVSSVTASASSEGAHGQPTNAVDGVRTTAWQVAGDGVGESIRLEFLQEVTITRCSVIPGYDKIEGSGWNRDRWLSTNRVTGVEITWVGGRQLHTFNDVRDFQDISFSNIGTNYVEFNIRRTVPGSTGRQSGDTALSEIACYGTGPEGGHPSGASAATPPASEEPAPAPPTPASERPASGGSERRAESPRSQPVSQQPSTPERAGTAGTYSSEPGSEVVNIIPSGANGCYMMQGNELIIKLRNAFAGTGTISVSGVVSQASVRERERSARAGGARGRRDRGDGAGAGQGINGEDTTADVYTTYYQGRVFMFMYDEDRWVECRDDCENPPYVSVTDTHLIDELNNKMEDDLATLESVSQGGLVGDSCGDLNQIRRGFKCLPADMIDSYCQEGTNFIPSGDSAPCDDDRVCCQFFGVETITDGHACNENAICETSCCDGCKEVDPIEGQQCEEGTTCCRDVVTCNPGIESDSRFSVRLSRTFNSAREGRTISCPAETFCIDGITNSADSCQSLNPRNIAARLYFCRNLRQSNAMFGSDGCSLAGELGCEPYTLPNDFFNPPQCLNGATENLLGMEYCSEGLVFESTCLPEDDVASKENVCGSNEVIPRTKTTKGCYTHNSREWWADACRRIDASETARTRIFCGARSDQQAAICNNCKNYGHDLSGLCTSPPCS